MAWLREKSKTYIKKSFYLIFNMKKLYLFSIGQLIKLVELLKPIIEIINQVINVFKKDKKEEEGGEEDDEESK